MPNRRRMIARLVVMLGAVVLLILLGVFFLMPYLVYRSGDVLELKWTDVSVRDGRMTVSHWGNWRLSRYETVNINDVSLQDTQGRVMLPRSYSVKSFKWSLRHSPHWVWSITFDVPKSETAVFAARLRIYGGKGSKANGEWHIKSVFAKKPAEERAGTPLADSSKPGYVWVFVSPESSAEWKLGRGPQY